MKAGTAGAHLVVPGRDTVQAVVLVQQVDGLTEKAAGKTEKQQLRARSVHYNQ